MCARFEQYFERVHRWSKLLHEWSKKRGPQYNIKPTQQAGTYDAEGLRERSWWLIPPWSKTPKIKYPTFNSRAETLADKPAFRHAWQHSQRCIVPASRYFEWTGPKGMKQCHAIERSDGEPHLLAGLWETWKGDDQTVESFTIVTVEAAPEIDWLHPRMPRTLEDETETDTWLHASPEEAAELLKRNRVDYTVAAINSPDDRS